MRTAKEYRRISWNAIRPHWRAMLLIALTAVLPQLIEFFLQLLFGLIPPIDMQFGSATPAAFWQPTMRSSCRRSRRICS